MKLRFGVDAPIYEVMDKGGFVLALNSHFCAFPYSGGGLPCFIFADLSCVGCHEQWHRIEGLAVRPVFQLEGRVSAAWLVAFDFQRRLVNTARCFFDEAVLNGYSFFHPDEAPVKNGAGVVVPFLR